ncbi:MAG: YfbM family protein [Phycisphaerales bacterium]
MSMVAVFVEVTNEQYRSFVADPQPDTLIAWMESEEDGQGDDAPVSMLDLDKDWHAVHFVLTGDVDTVDSPEGFILGGEEVGEEFGYGPARAMDAAQVAEASRALQAISPEQFQARIDLKAMAKNDVYPSVWDRDDIVLDGIVDAYTNLRSWLAGVAGRNNPVLLVLT